MTGVAIWRLLALATAVSMLEFLICCLAIDNDVTGVLECVCLSECTEFKSDGVLTCVLSACELDTKLFVSSSCVFAIRPLCLLVTISRLAWVSEFSELEFSTWFAGVCVLDGSVSSRDSIGVVAVKLGGGGV